MRRLSSDATLFFKRVFPAFWFGGVGLACVVMIVAAIAGTVNGRADTNILYVFVLVPVVMALFGYFLMRNLIFDLVDEVLDDGGTLVIRNKGREERIALANIINISEAQFTRPPRVTLTLRDACSFGKDLTFIPTTRILPFGRHPIVAELIERVDAARRQG